MNLDDVIDMLDKQHQRASYGAVAGIFGVAPNGLMVGRPRNHEHSWVVAATNNRQTGSRRGWPTGYADVQIHPECVRQIRESPENFIKDTNDLSQWLIGKTKRRHL